MDVLLLNLGLIVIILIVLVFCGISEEDYQQQSKATHPKKFKCIVTGDTIKDDSYYTMSGKRCLRLTRQSPYKTYVYMPDDLVIPQKYSNERIVGLISDAANCFIITHWRVMYFKSHWFHGVNNGKIIYKREWNLLKTFDSISYEKVLPFIKSRLEYDDFNKHLSTEGK